MLKIDPKTQEVTTFGGPWPGNWKWHGGVLAPDGCIYGIPQMAEQVLKIDVASGTCTLIGKKFPGTRPYKPHSIITLEFGSDFRFVFPLLREEQVVWWFVVAHRW